MAETSSEQLIIRFRGICGHIDLPNGNSAKKKRTVLVRHQNGNGNGNIEAHVPFIEFFADDMEASSEDLLVTPFSRPGVEGRFARITLDKPVVIRLKGISAGEVEEDLGYERTVPHIGEILGGGVSVVKELLTKKAEDVKSKRVSAIFDMPEGRLVGGEPEPLLTRFDPKVGFKPRRLARWSDLYIGYKPPLVLELVTLGTEDEIQEITFKDSLRMLTIGNEPDRLSFGVFDPSAANGQGDGHAHTHNGGSGSTPVQTTGHYILYYDLIENPPEDRPVPIPPQFDGSGCPNSNFP